MDTKTLNTVESITPVVHKHDMIVKDQCRRTEEEEEEDENLTTN